MHAFTSFEACLDSPFRGTPNGKRTTAENCRTPKDGKRQAAWPSSARGDGSTPSSSSAPNRSTPKFNGGDRFIPNRAVMDFEVSHFELTRPQARGAGPENANVNASPAKEEYKKELAATLMHAAQPSNKVLAFQSQAQARATPCTPPRRWRCSTRRTARRASCRASTRATSRRRPSASSTPPSSSTTTTSTCSTGPRPTCSAWRWATRSTCGTRPTAPSSSSCRRRARART